MNVAFDGPWTSLTVLFAAIVAVALVASWVILAGSRFLQGGVVERPERVPQLYGYTVCLIGLLMAVVSGLSMAETGLRLATPELAPSEGWAPFGISVSSFEAFRATYEREREFRVRPDASPPEPLSEAELRRRYDALRSDRISRVRLDTQHSLLTSALTLIVGAGLFVFHWRWLKHRSFGVPPA
jgi:hypothetical protein